MTRDISSADTKERLLKSPDALRPVEDPDTSYPPPIVIFGCSFAYGTGLADKETISYHLGKLTKRTVYNMAQGGMGVQHMLYKLQQNEFYDIVKKPEYVLYVFFNGHYSRLYSPVCLFCPICYTVYYKDKGNNELELKKRNFLSDKFIMFNPIKEKIIRYLISYTDKGAYFFDNEIAKYIIASKNEINKHYPDVKFIVFFYDEPLTNTLYKNLESENIYTIKREDYKIDPYLEEFRLEDGHPSALFWETVTPVIVNKLKEI